MDKIVVCIMLEQILKCGPPIEHFCCVLPLLQRRRYCQSTISPTGANCCVCKSNTVDEVRMIHLTALPRRLVIYDTITSSLVTKKQLRCTIILPFVFSSVYIDSTSYQWIHGFQKTISEVIFADIVKGVKRSCQFTSNFNFPVSFLLGC